MTYERFEDVPVWQKAAQLYEATEELLENHNFEGTRGFRDQLERAVLSVSNNIAEGFERGTTNELLAFIYIARGSAGEARSMLLLPARQPWISNFKSQTAPPDFKSPIPGADLKSQISELIKLAESCSRQLRA